MLVTSNTSPFPYLYIENLYTDKELELIFNELDYFQSNENIFLSDSLEATDTQGNSLAIKKSLFLDHIFRNRDFSNILKINSKKIFKPGFICRRSDNYFFKNFAPTKDYTLISYYENGGKYNSHCDESVATLCVWLWKEPKKFQMGNFYFPEFDLKFEVQNNHAIVFPGSILHAVDEVKMSFDNAEAGYGRYSICNFMNFNLS